MSGLRLELRRRLVAVLALLALTAAVAAGVISVTQGAIGRLVIAAVALVAVVLGGWHVIASRGVARLAGGLVALAAVVTVIALLVTSFRNGLALELALLLVGVSVVAARYALDSPAGDTADRIGDDAPASKGRGTRC